MKNTKVFFVLFLVSIFLIGKSFTIPTSAGAFNGKPPCCVFLPAEWSPKLLDEMKGVEPIAFKLFGKVTKVINSSMSVRILALIDKAIITDVSKSQIVIDVSIKNALHPKLSGVVSLGSITDKDYILLLPTKIYNEKLQENMYDFVKIPVDMIK